jgi:hypothetical protein
MELKQTLSKIVFSFSLVVFLAGAGCGSSSTDVNTTNPPVRTGSNDSVTQTMTGFSVYENSSYGFKMQYPKDWTKEEGSNNTIVTFKSPQGKNDKFIENVNLVNEDVSQVPGISLDAYEQAAVKIIKESSELKDFKQVESKSMTLSGLPGKSVAYTSLYAPNGLKLYTRQYFTIKDKMVYIITYTASQDDPSAFMDVVQKMVGSFQLSK